jgi:glyoxylase-like metal-dependent hydrolase (beta-lactamase superfamily II)
MLKKPLTMLAVVSVSVAVGATVDEIPAVARQAAPGNAGIRTYQVAPQVHMIAGDGANIAVQAGPDGVVVVDSGAGSRSEAVLAAIKAISPQPIRFVINTSADPAHVGGNAAIAAAGEALGGGAGGTIGGGGASVVAGVRTGAARLGHENVLLRMSATVGDKPAFAEPLWPTEGYIDVKNLYLNGEAIQLIHMPAVSDSDSIAFFRRSDVIATGHIVDATRFPMIDVAHGGSIQGEIAALNKLIELAIPPTPLPWQPGGTQVIPARGPVLEQAELVDYRDMVTYVRDLVQSLIKKGMTLEQIQKAEPTKGYTRRYGADSGPWTTAKFVEAVYASLTKAGTR